MKYLKKFESREISIDPYLKKIYVSNNDFTDLYDEIKTLTNYKFDFELYYRVDEKYIFNIIVFIKSNEYTMSKSMHYYGYIRYDTLKSHINTSDANIMKNYLNELTDWTHINNKNDIETEITANKFNI